MFPHLYNASVPVTTILSALTARGGHLAFLVDGEPLGFQGVFLGFDGWTLVPFALGLAFFAKELLGDLRRVGLKRTVELAKDSVGGWEGAPNFVLTFGLYLSAASTVLTPAFFVLLSVCFNLVCSHNQPSGVVSVWVFAMMLIPMFLRQVTLVLLLSLGLLVAVNAVRTVSRGVKKLLAGNLHEEQGEN